MLYERFGFAEKGGVLTGFNMQRACPFSHLTAPNMHRCKEDYGASYHDRTSNTVLELCAPGGFPRNLNIS